MKLTIKQKTILSALIFVTFCLFSAFLGWLCGYDFNVRRPDVAAWVAMTVLMAAAVSAVALSAIALI
jgi:hypothetical protein